jgi:hypothetical protein
MVGGRGAMKAASKRAIPKIDQDLRSADRVMVHPVPIERRGDRA